MPRRCSYRKRTSKRTSKSRYTGVKHFTKYCNKLFVGCTNPDCTFAHSASELRGPEWDAWTDKHGFPTRFFRPDDADPTSKDLRPKASVPFVVRFYEDESSEEDIEQPIFSLSKKDIKQPIFSLSKEIDYTEKWKQRKMVEARWARMWHVAKARHALTDTGERDMDMSDDDKPKSDLRELDMELDSDDD
jgi:hypothetical protein